MCSSDLVRHLMKFSNAAQLVLLHVAPLIGLSVLEPEDLRARLRLRVLLDRFLNYVALKHEGFFFFVCVADGALKQTALDAIVRDFAARLQRLSELSVSDAPVVDRRGADVEQRSKVVISRAEAASDLCLLCHLGAILGDIAHRRKIHSPLLRHIVVFTIFERILLKPNMDELRRSIEQLHVHGADSAVLPADL